MGKGASAVVLWRGETLVAAPFESSNSPHPRPSFKEDSETRSGRKKKKQREEAAAPTGFRCRTSNQTGEGKTKAGTPAAHTTPRKRGTNAGE